MTADPAGLAGVIAGADGCPAVLGLATDTDGTTAGWVDGTGAVVGATGSGGADGAGAGGAGGLVGSGGSGGLVVVAVTGSGAGVVTVTGPPGVRSPGSEDTRGGGLAGTV